MKRSVVCSAIVFSSFINCSQLHSMDICEIESQNSTHTIIRCTGQCQKISQWDSWESNVTYIVGGAVLGVAIPYLPTMLRYVCRKVKECFVVAEINAIVLPADEDVAVQNSVHTSVEDPASISVEEDREIVEEHQS